MTQNLTYGRHATPDYAPQFGIYVENGDGNDLAIVKGDSAESYAALFAASPDMLAALEDCHRHLFNMGGLDAESPLLVKIRAAIAKAKGE